MSEPTNWKAVAEDLATALERLDALYVSEQDPEAPLNRPQWLTEPLKIYYKSVTGELK